MKKVDGPTMYALAVQSKATELSSNELWFWVARDADGWADASGRQLLGRGSIEEQMRLIPDDIKTFKTIQSAEKFAKRWKGFPWWVKPNGSYRVVEIKERWVMKREGYQFFGVVK